MKSPRKGSNESPGPNQSKALVWTAGSLLVAETLLPWFTLRGTLFSSMLLAGIVSLTFGTLVWVLRAATAPAAFFGALVCYNLMIGTLSHPLGLAHSALTPLVLLFVLTFLATRLGKRRRPELTSTREARHGRAASQILANLGLAPLLLLASLANSLFPKLNPACFSIASTLALAALAEATADTLSSELGQAFGGTPYLLTTLRPAAPGTDGAVSPLGTAAGLTGAALICLAGAWAMHLGPRQLGAAFAGSAAGLFFDSLLGATLERRGRLNNDLVNFCSTAFAAAATLLLLRAA